MAKNEEVLSDYQSTVGTIDSIIGAVTGTTAAEAASATAMSKAEKAAAEEATKQTMIAYGTIAVGLVVSAFLGVIYFSRR